MDVNEFQARAMDRRRFLGDTAVGMAAGMSGLAAFADSPAERLRIGVIGVRSQGRKLACTLAGLPDVEVAALCDVDEEVLAATACYLRNETGRQPARASDFRHLLEDDSLDAVVIATPDHWHAYLTIAACRAGKDVYVETPLSHHFAEGPAIIDAARTHGRIVQCGLQQRSGEHFRSAIEVIHSGQIGAVRLAKAWSAQKRQPLPVEPKQTPAAGVDYDLWLGPAPQQSFSERRFHHHWQAFWDYGSGELGHWGPHLLDVARWGLQVEFPERVSASGGTRHFDDGRETPDQLSVLYTFADCTIAWEHRQWTARGCENRNAAVAFYGENGTLVVDRSGWKVYDVSETLVGEASELRGAHLRNWIDSIRTRNRPAAPPEVAHISTGLAQLGNISSRLDREVRFDAANATCIDDADADALLAGQHRSPWNPLS